MNTTNYPDLDTQDLRLVCLSIDFLEAMRIGDFAKAEQIAGFRVLPTCSLLKHSSIERRLELIKKDATQQPWMYRAIVQKADNTMVGHISFHHKAPDPDCLEYSNNAAELGYTIEASYRRKGYATQSIKAMLGWATKLGVHDFILSISPSNLPSVALAESLGFKKIAERMDEVDGLEFVYIGR